MSTITPKETTDFGVDPDVLRQFCDESLEMLGETTQPLTLLFGTQRNPVAIEKILGIVRTTKGNAPFFNLMRINAMAHAIDDLLSVALKNNLSFNDSLHGLLTKGMAYLRDALERVRDGKTETDNPVDFNAIARKIREASLNDGINIDQGIVYRVVKDQLEELTGLIPGDEADLHDLLTRIRANLGALKPVTPPETPVYKPFPSIVRLWKQQVDILLNTPVDDMDRESMLQLRDLLAQLREVALDRGPLNSALEVFDTTFASLGVTQFLHDFIQDKLAETPFPDNWNEEAPANQIRGLKPLRCMLEKSIWEPGDTDNIRLMLEKIRQQAAGTFHLDEAIEVMHLVAEHDGMTPFLRDYLIEKLDSTQWKA